MLLLTKKIRVYLKKKIIVQVCHISLEKKKGGPLLGSVVHVCHISLFYFNKKLLETEIRN